MIRSLNQPINQYDFPLAIGMAETVNALIEQLAPR